MLEANLKQKSAMLSSDDEAEGFDMDCLSWLESLVIGGASTAAGNRNLLVLSLGGLLCERVLIRQNRSRISNARRHYDATYGSFVVYKRPHCEAFLKFCFERFDVAIWSTAKRWYTENALDCVISGLKKSDLVFVWNQEHCTDSGFKTLHNNDKPIFLKELHKIWGKRWTSANRQYSASDTLMIELDDEPDKTLMNPPNTAVFAPAYNFENDEDAVLAPGGELWMFLDGLSRAEDVGLYLKSNSYGPPAITEDHTDWAYYQQIILAHSRSN